jgi:cell division initiation protein
MSELNKLTAQDVRHQEFSTKFRGYDKEEVDQFLEMLAEYLENDISQKGELKQKIELLEKQLEEFKNLEATMKNTLLRTQESVDDVRRTAEKESELIIREAQIKADQLIEERRERIRQLEGNYQVLQMTWDEYFVKFKHLLTSHLETLDKMEDDYRNLTKKSTEPES